MIIRFLYLAKSCENPCFSWISIIFPLWIGSYFKLIYSTPLDQNSSPRIFPFYASINTPFWNLKLTFITWYSYRFLYLHSLPGILHPACACHSQQHQQKSHFTLQLHSLPSITSNLFSLTITIMPSTKHVTQQKIQQYMPPCMPRVMSHSTATMAVPVKEWLLSYLVA